MAEPIAIESLDDPRVAVYRDVRDADLRGRDKLFMAESEIVVRRLLRTPHRLHSLLLSPQRHERMREAVNAAPEVPVYTATVELISEIAGFHIHRGVLAAGFRPTAAELSIDAALGHLRSRAAFCLLAAEGLTNVDNMGALFRNAAAFGVDGIVLDPTCCDPLYRKAIRVSMGHVLSVPFAVCASWPDDLERLQEQWRAQVIAAETGPGSEPLWRMGRLERPLVLLGSEGQGLSAGALRYAEGRFEIPMAPDVPSLNVAVASALVLYELGRDR